MLGLENSNYNILILSFRDLSYNRQKSSLFWARELEWKWNWCRRHGTAYGYGYCTKSKSSQPELFFEPYSFNSRSMTSFPVTAKRSHFICTCAYAHLTWAHSARCTAAGTCPLHIHTQRSSRFYAAWNQTHCILLTGEDWGHDDYGIDLLTICITEFWRLG